MSFCMICFVVCFVFHLNKIPQNKEGNALFNDALNKFNFTVIWRCTYGKGPLR